MPRVYAAALAEKNRIVLIGLAPPRLIVVLPLPAPEKLAAWPLPGTPALQFVAVFQSVSVAPVQVEAFTTTAAENVKSSMLKP